MKFSARSQYAIEAMLALAESTAGQPVQVRAISREHGIPIRFLEQIMASLKKAGLVKSIRGARGGYLLSAEASAIRVSQVLQAVEGPIREGPDTDEPAPPAAQVVFALWREAQETVRQVFDSITIEELSKRKQETENARSIMYHI
ncbi:MAG: RrF2 family transcriptional regulator [Leptospirillia bacterium]